MATNFPDTSVNNTFVTPNRPWEDGDIFDDTANSGLIYYWYDPVWKTKASDVTAADLTVSSLNGGPLAGFRNLIINGDFRIWQRYDANNLPDGNQYGVKITSSSLFGCDRWSCRNPNNSKGEVAQIRLNGLTSGLRLSVSGATDYQLIQTKIERSNLFQVNNKECTLSLKCNRSTVRARVRIYAYDGTFTDVVESTEVPKSLGDDRYSWTFTITPPIGAGAGSTGNPESNDTGMQIILYPDGLNTVNGDTNFDNVQLEVGPVATPFEQRPIGTELALCQRYYYRFRSSGELVNTARSGSGTANWPITLPTPMRISVPSIEGTIGLRTQSTVGGGGVSTNDWHRAVNCDTGKGELQFLTTTTGSANTRLTVHEGSNEIQLNAEL